jgi:hypothetical protein
MISSHTGKMRRTDSPRSNSCQLTIQKARIFASDIIGYLFGYAHLTNTRSLALVDDPEANAYELLVSLSSEEEDQFLELVRSNLDMGNDYIENDLLSPTTEEIKDARPLAMVPPQDVLNRAMLIAATLLCCVVRPAHNRVGTFGKRWARLSDGQETQKTRFTRYIVLRIGQVR